MAMLRLGDRQASHLNTTGSQVRKDNPLTLNLHLPHILPENKFSTPIA